MRPDRSLKILLVEDNLINQKVASRLLERQGHVVTIVSNGREALDTLSLHAFDLVLMDVTMPEMDGLTAAAFIRQSEEGSDRHQPIVALTALARMEDRERCLAAGMDGYATKPVQIDLLLRVMAETLTKVGAR